MKKRGPPFENVQSISQGGAEKWKSSNDDKHGQGQEKRTPSTYVEGKNASNIQNVRDKPVLSFWGSWGAGEGASGVARPVSQLRQVNIPSGAAFRSVSLPPAATQRRNQLLENRSKCLLHHVNQGHISEHKLNEFLRKGKSASM